MKITDYFQDIQPTRDQLQALEKLQAFLETDQRVFILRGYAGTGKTTLLKGVVKYLEGTGAHVQLMAPTGRAAKVIHQKTGFEATTIHKGIYDFKHLEEIKVEGEGDDYWFLSRFVIKNDPLAHETVFIVDEASMISNILHDEEFYRCGTGYLLNDLLEYAKIFSPTATSKIIFVGDPAQLPPVGMHFSPALDPDYFRETFQIAVSSAEIKEVMRQDAENGILHAAISIRKALSSGYFNEFNLKGNGKDIFNINDHEVLATYKQQQEPKMIICYGNKMAFKQNMLIRKDKFGGDFPIQPSDRVIVGANNYRLDILNGEFGIVAEVSPHSVSRNIRLKGKKNKLQATEKNEKIVNLTWRWVEIIFPDKDNQDRNVNGYMLENYLYGDGDLTSDERRALYVDFKNRYPHLKPRTKAFRDAILEDRFYNCMLLKFGYAITCHKAQGGEWDHVFLFWDGHTGKNNSFFYRWTYTAVTRATQRLYCVDPPYFTPFSNMIFIDIPVLHEYQKITGINQSTDEISLYNVLPLLEQFGLANEPVSIQDHFIHKWYRLKEYDIYIKSWQKIQYEIRYVFRKKDETAAFKYWINKNNQFKDQFQIIPSFTNSQKLAQQIIEILMKSAQVHVVRNDGTNTNHESDPDYLFQDDKPFLRLLYDKIKEYLPAEMMISDVKHLSYCERYTFSQNQFSCVVDFLYDKNGFFGNVKPIPNQCNSQEMLNRIKAIVNVLRDS